MCKAGVATPHPILPSTAEKYRSELDWRDSGPTPLSFIRSYRSSRGPDAYWLTGVLSKTWTHNHSPTLKVTTRDASGSPTAVAITTPEGYLRTFFKTFAASVWTATNGADTLTGNGPWTYRRAEDDLTQNFDDDGRLVSQTERNGWTTSYAYGNGHLASVTNAFGRTLTFQYNGASQLASVTTPDARVIHYGYDSTGRLSSVTYPDGKSRSFVYENAAFPHALTGILDESGARWGTFAYDSQGRAISTELAGAADRYQVSYPSTGSATVVDPLGTTRSYSYGTTFGKLAVVGGTLPSGEGEADAASRVQDANGLITSETDFKGVKTNTAWDVPRRLPTSVTHAVGTPEERTVTTQWHATFALPVLVTEPGRTTAWTYDASGNPLSRTVTHTGTSPNKTQTTSWTYTPQGLVATETVPNGAVTSYTYDASGNVLSATNALGHATSYGYDSANRVTSQTAPSGLVTTYAWDARDRLLTQTVGGQQTTTLTYTAPGQIATLTLPTGLSLSYTYDTAHRLTGWSNNRGESGSFTLDAMGNRVAEQIKDASGAIAWSAARTVNNINRLSARTEGSSQTDTFGYDANGELIAQTNGLNQSTRYGLDGLRRLKTLTNPANATASLGYDALDAITQASDFKGVATSYARDAQGNATQEASADVGSRGTEYDALGLPSRIVDALGQATQIQRDALGRPTQLSFADGQTTTLRYDLTGGSYNESGFSRASRGYLSEIADRSGTTVYKRDLFGRVTVKSQTLANSYVRRLRYAYTGGGDLDTLTYPDGSRLRYQRDATGRIAQMDWNDQPLVTGLQWNPLGQPTGWNWAFADDSEGITVSAYRGYDTAGRLTQTEFSSYVYDAAGRITSLTQNLWKPANTNPLGSAIDSADVTWSVGYDAVGRIVSFGNASSTASFSYDANGNRTASSQTANGATTSRSYAVSANRLTGFSQTAGGASTSVAYGYNANGDMTGDGLRSYAYDAEGRLASVTTGATDSSPTTRYAHNALGQRVFKTEPLYPPSEGDEQDAGFFQGLTNFFSQLWSPSAAEAEQLGFAYVYDEEGSLIGEYGMGGAESTGSTKYMYLPTASGPMPIMAFVGGHKYAVHADHLNTPRRLTRSNGRPTWQWAYSAFGDEEPTTAAKRFTSPYTVPATGSTNVPAVVFNKRYDGMYADVESGLFYNYFRSYRPSDGTYTQNDPMGLAAGFNRRVYVGANPLNYSDSNGLFLPALAIPFIGATGIGMADIGIGLGLGATGYGLDRMFAKPPENAYDPNGPKAPGKPSEAEGFKDPKGGEDWVRNPNGRGSGWKGADGGVWCPTGPDSGSTGDAHGGPHWDVQYPGGRYDNVYPGGRRR
jgi:RHS repeat-associated protein